ncbi:alpha/beta fold hydrolase [Variovorax sp. RT4R15]|uniref:alpha/beta fold hydrolase n=1 Tax=Variovorax sp. RT4R15 TaxID=3443737 RepID=UPI003F4463C1
MADHALQDRLALRLFGVPGLFLDGVDTGLALRRAFALLGYLAHAGRPVSRSVLAGLLWPDASEAQARTRLRRLVYAVDHQVGGALFEADATSIGLGTRTLHVDVLAFAREAKAAASLPPADPPALAALQQWSERAVQPIFGGMSSGAETLDDWVRGLQIEHDQLHRRLLAMLAERHAADGDVAAAIALAERLVRMGPGCESSYVLLMELEARSGNASSVEAVYARCAEALRADYGIAPSAQTEAAYATLMRKLAGARASVEREPLNVRYAASTSGALAYAMLGDRGDALVVAPGFLSNIEIGWEDPYIRAFIQRLAAHFRVVMFDRRGVGLSERLDVNSSAHATATDIRLILDDAGIEKAWIFGSSEGGPAAITMAVDHPARVQGLLLFGAMAKGCSAPDYPHALPPGAFDVWLSRLVAVWGGPAGIEAFAPEAQADPALRAWWARMIRHSTSPGALAETLRAFRDVDVREDAARVRCPALVMHRTGDRAVRVGAGADLARRISGSKWLELEGDDHWWWRGDTRPLLDAMFAFVQAR